ncbi:D-alanine--D-alanine ligase family protein [Acidicapsa dinghuensis]|uniref:D-alanine--D-alanine ligase n=1 Tax=Acidicapsa dinghuensis TaxID=2218256 RepID=A0ABW1EKH4_9BACT|nr:D-alanine--D-alanine ligase family protein [Acidicapsa dinghuensis]
MAKKLRVGILFGGRSGEHEVSLLSAASILKAIDRKKFEVFPIGISKQGHWLTGGAAQALLEGTSAESSGLVLSASSQAAPVGTVDALVPDAAALNAIQTASASSASSGKPFDVVFPVLHGTFGEDGTIQGLFELADIAYVGSGVLGSSAGMDKDVMKRLFAQAGLPIVKHITVLRSAWETSPRKTISSVEAELTYPLFVKPANLGSSVGISKAHDRKELGPAIALAARYDRKIVIEQGVTGSGKSGKAKKARELEVAVLGNDDPKASVVGEIVPGKEFYDYEAKYLSDGSIPIIPAKLTREESKRIREMAVQAFRACDLAGLARVDFLMEPDGKRRIYLNEVNTLPGFTSISMYPKLWQASDLSYSDLITRLIELGLERHKDRARTTFSYDVPDQKESK